MSPSALNRSEFEYAEAMRDESLEAVLWFFVDPHTEGLRAKYSRGLFECGQNVLYIASTLGRPPLGAADEVQALY